MNHCKGLIPTSTRKKHKGYITLLLHKAMAILDYSKDANKSIVIRFYNHEYGPEGQPLYYHTHENPAVIKGYVEFSTIKEIKASDIVLTFEARAESKWTEEQNGSYISYNYIDRLQQHSWPIPLKRANTTNQNIITPGVTRYDFSLQLDPDLPPSIEGRRGWFHYRFKALMQRDFPYRNMAVKHLIWVYSSSLRADQVHEPKVYRHVWNKVSSVTCTLPSNVFYQGQVVPLTIRIEPFLEKNVYQGQTLLVSSAIVKMKQYTVLRDPRGLKAKQKEKKDIFVLPVMEDWPATNEVYERIVEIELPGARKLAASIETVPVTKTHRLKLIMMVRTDDSNKKSTKELRVEMDVKITSPRPEHIKNQPLEYSPPLYQDNENEQENFTPPGYVHLQSVQYEDQDEIQYSESS